MKDNSTFMPSYIKTIKKPKFPALAEKICILFFRNIRLYYMYKNSGGCFEIRQYVLIYFSIIETELIS